MQLYEKAENREGQMLAGQTVGLLALARGEWDAAEKELLAVLQFGRELGNPLAQAFALGHLGRVAQYRGNYGAAQASIRQGLEALGTNGDARARAELSLFLAGLSFELGMMEAGSEAPGVAQGLLDVAGSLEQRAEWLRLTAIGHLRAGRLTEARRSFEEARVQAVKSGSVIARIASELGATEAALAAGESGSAMAALVKL